MASVVVADGHGSGGFASHTYTIGMQLLIGGHSITETELATLAAQRWAEAKVMNVRSPVQVAVRAVPPANMKWLKGMPGVQYENEQASFTAVDMVAAYQGMETIVEALGPSFSDAELSSFNAQPDAKQQRQKGMEELYRRWFEAESGRAPIPPAPAKLEGTYHGFK